MTSLACSVEALPVAERLRVALLTDRPGAQHYLQRELRRRGVEVIIPHSGEELIAGLRDGSQWIDAVFVDLGHQTQNALTLLRELADEFPMVRRVAISDGALLLRRMAARFGRTSLVLEHPLDGDSLERVLGALDAVIVGSH